jgi:hypothetical protein
VNLKFIAITAVIALVAVGIVNRVPAISKIVLGT